MSKTTKSEENVTAPASTEENTSGSEQPVCGVVMPISTIDNCPAEHWLEVKSIIYDAISSAGYTPNLVSESDDSGLIHRRIIQNLYNNDIVVVDVSAKNPNVMFELGIRLAFDKPTIVIKDDATDYSFDTSPIEHIPYPRTLRFHSIVAFKKRLKEKIEGTIKAEKEDPENYTSFLKHFGQFTVAKLENKSVTVDTYMIEMLKELKRDVESIKKTEHKIFNPEDYSSEETRFNIAPVADFEMKMLNVLVLEFLKNKTVSPEAIMMAPTLMDDLIIFVFNKSSYFRVKYGSDRGDKAQFRFMLKQALFQNK